MASEVCSICGEVKLLGADAWKRPLSTTQVAELLGVSRQTVHAWIVQGRIPAKRHGRNWKVPRELVDGILKGEFRVD